jgi:hypothetical protein
MKEHPILFNDEMVRKILEGRKRETRRVIKARSKHIPDPQKLLLDGWKYRYAEGAVFVNRGPGTTTWIFDCPYGEAGDRLWVREAWRYKAESLFSDNPEVEYRASAPNPRDGQDWKPSIHMPRWASRITLEVVEVQVERIQDISRASITAEGVKVSLLERLNFQELWDSINEKRGYGWDANPWVWVVAFRDMDAFDEG